MFTYKLEGALSAISKRGSNAILQCSKYHFPNGVQTLLIVHKNTKKCMLLGMPKRDKWRRQLGAKLFFFNRMKCKLFAFQNNFKRSLGKSVINNFLLKGNGQNVTEGVVTLLIISLKI